MSHKSFSGETPYVICEQYGAGKIDRAQLVDELTRWKYAPQDRTTEMFDDLLFEVPVSVDDLNRRLPHRGHGRDSTGRLTRNLTPPTPTYKDPMRAAKQIVNLHYSECAGRRIDVKF